MAKEQPTKLLHVLVLTAEQYRLLTDAVFAQQETAHDDAHHVDEDDEDHAELLETAAAYDELAAAVSNGWDVQEADEDSLHCALDQLSFEA